MYAIRRLAAPLAFLAAASFAPAASAQSDLDFAIENATGYTISEIYLSPNKKDNWGKQVLSSPLKNGEKRKIVFKPTAKVQAYDLKAVYADGAGSPVWYDLNPANFSKLTLKWDKSKNKTVAVKSR
jgi:hypothetical protein